MPQRQKLYHRDGQEVEMYGVDARQALRNHPKEWSTRPFKEGETRTARQPAAAQPAQPEGQTQQQAQTQQATTENRTTPADYDPHRDDEGRIDIPDDWESKPHFSKVALANEITGKNDRTLKSEEAERIIRDYAAAQQPPTE